MNSHRNRTRSTSRSRREAERFNSLVTRAAKLGVDWQLDSADASRAFNVIDNSRRVRQEA